MDSSSTEHSAVLRELQGNTGVFCALMLSTVAAGVASGVACGAHRFRLVAAVSVLSLLLVFVPVLVYAQQRTGGASYRLLLGASVGYNAAVFVGDSVVVLLLGPRPRDDVAEAGEGEGKAEVRARLLGAREY